MSDVGPAGTRAGHEEASTYPRFSDAEMARRWKAAESVMAEVDDLVVYGADRSGAPVQWLARWPVTREAALLWRPGDERPVLLVQFANHVDNADRLAEECDVRWGGVSTTATLAELLARRHRGSYRLGVVGRLPGPALATLAAGGAEPVHLDGAFSRLRLHKSAEELAWARRGAALTDAAVHALVRDARPGLRETELAAIVESAYRAEGGTNHIHYFATTPMREPRIRVPAQWQSDRRLRVGDVVTCEVSASWWGYPGQLLRTFTVGEPPTSQYADLHAVADAAFASVSAAVAPGASGATLADAGRLIGEAGFQTCDDLVHGFVGGYLPPVVPGGGRPSTHDDFVLEEGMTVVVQPNVVTSDGTAGVQTGELLVVTERGAERLHAFPPGIGRIGS